VNELLSELADRPDHGTALAVLVGQASGPPQMSPHAVNAPMIRHWVEAMGDTNPVYVSDAAARAHRYEGIVAPATMLQAWIMRGLRATQAVEEARASGSPGSGDPMETVMQLLDDEGFTSVVATNCEQSYLRPLVPGDRVFVQSFIDSISDPKRTGLGTGRFLTTRLDFTAQPDAAVPDDPSPAQVADLAATGEAVATMVFRILKFLPPADRPAPRPLRPRPARTQDNDFWFEGARAQRLLIQRCTACGTLRHPPLPACGTCQSLEWDTVEASGRGTLYSFVVVHHPQVAAFDYPLPIGLVELEEGTRVVANLDGQAPDQWRIGTPVMARFVRHDDELTLPVFVPASAEGTH
jgi:uncharacterized OB-fold protein